MKSLSLCLVLLIATATGVVPTEAQEAASRTIPARVVPVPSSVSLELQKILAQPPSPGAKPPKTTEDWRALTAQSASAEEATSEELAKLRKQFGVNVTSQVMGGVPCYIVTPKEILPRNRNRLILNIHPGGFIWGRGESATGWAIPLAGALGYRVIVADYRLLPDYPFPAAADDLSAVWKSIVNSSNPKNTAVIGGSVGGGLVLSLVQRAKSDGVPLSGAVVSGSPGAADLSKTGDTWYTNAGVGDDVVYDGFWEAVFKFYVNGRDLKDPAVSPPYGDFNGFPPTYLVSGTRDVFLSDTARAQSKLMQAHVRAHLVVVEGAPHAGLFDIHQPEVMEVYRDIAQFLDANLGR